MKPLCPQGPFLACLLGLFLSSSLFGNVTVVRPGVTNDRSGTASADAKGNPTFKEGVAKPSTAKNQALDQKEEALESQIKGIPIQRADGTWVALRVEGGVFVLGFYDAKKQTTKPDAFRASARWNPPQKTGSAFCVLSNSGETLNGNIPVQPPRIFKVYVTLLDQAGNVRGSFVFDYRDTP